MNLQPKEFLCWLLQFNATFMLATHSEIRFLQLVIDTQIVNCKYCMMILSL